MIPMYEIVYKDGRTEHVAQNVEAAVKAGDRMAADGKGNPQTNPYRFLTLTVYYILRMENGLNQPFHEWARTVAVINAVEHGDDEDDDVDGDEGNPTD